MSPFPHETRRVKPPWAFCARASTSTGSRLRNNVRASPNPVVDHPRVSAAVEPAHRSPLPLLSQLLLLCPYGDRPTWCLTRVVAESAPPPPLSPLQQGRLRPCAGQENDQCLIPAFSFGLRWPSSCI